MNGHAETEVLYAYGRLSISEKNRRHACMQCTVLSFHRSQLRCSVRWLQRTASTLLLQQLKSQRGSSATSRPSAGGGILRLEVLSRLP